jgi:hypothetical protein
VRFLANAKTEVPIKLHTAIRGLTFVELDGNNKSAFLHRSTGDETDQSIDRACRTKTRILPIHRHRKGIFGTGANTIGLDRRRSWSTTQ